MQRPVVQEEGDETMITINIYYTGENGNAKKFAHEMVSDGIVERIRAVPDKDRKFIRE